MSISTKAMLVSMSIRSWSARRYDRKVSQEVADQHEADHKVGRYNKCLIDPKSQTFLALAQARQAAYDWHQEQTLPWAQDGARVLPADNYFEYVETAAAHRTKFLRAADEFVDAFPQLQADARVALNGLYRATDYPSVDELRAKFNFDVTFLPVPDARDWRVSLGKTEEDAIRQQITAQVEGAASDAMRDVWTRLHTAVQHMVERLSDPDAIFRDSLVKNIQHLCDLLPRLNLMKDPHLDIMLDEVRSKLAPHHPQRLRDDKDQRSKVAEEAREIASRMAGYF